MAMNVTVKKFGRPRRTVELGESSATVSSVLTAAEIPLEGLTILVDNVAANGETLVRDGSVIELAPKASGGAA